MQKEDSKLQDFLADTVWHKDAGCQCPCRGLSKVNQSVHTLSLKSAGDLSEVQLWVDPKLWSQKDNTDMGEGAPTTSNAWAALVSEAQLNRLLMVSPWDRCGDSSWACSWNHSLSAKTQSVLSECRCYHPRLTTTSGTKHYSELNVIY